MVAHLKKILHESGEEEIQNDLGNVCWINNIVVVVVNAGISTVCVCIEMIEQFN